MNDDPFENESGIILDDAQLIWWIDLAPGEFHVSHISHNPGHQTRYIQRLEKLVGIGFLERVGNKRGWYRPRKTELEKLDFVNVEQEPVDIWLPFGLSEKVEIHGGNVIIIAGSPNSGKTACMLNIIYENQDKGWDIHYFSSEMGAEELRKRLDKFPYRSIDDWNFKAYSRAGDFADVIKKGKNSLNIVDFLEVHDEFYVIGKKIKEIHDKLKGGIAVIGLQKNPGSDTGLGGFRMLEVTRLAIALDSGRVKIVKAKNFRTTENPNGLMLNFKLVQGCQFMPQERWYRET